MLYLVVREGWNKKDPFGRVRVTEKVNPADGLDEEYHWRVNADDLPVLSPDHVCAFMTGGL